MTEDIKKFWEWCGFRYSERGNLFGWLAPNAELPYNSKLPGLTLDNLFRWAVPRVASKNDELTILFREVHWTDGSIFTECVLAVLGREISRSNVKGKLEEEAAQALYQAICKVMEAA